MTETNGAAIQQGSATSAFPHWPGQFKQTALAMVSRGARMIEYWHWHTLPYGIENHWSGILPHSLKPGRSFESFRQTSKSLEAVSKLGPLSPAAEVAIVTSTASKWLFEFQGPLRLANGLADPLGYVKTLQSVYEIAFDTGLGVRLIADNQLAEYSQDPAAFAQQHPIMILHSLYATERQTLEFAVAYAKAGGHLLVGPRTGYAAEDGVIRTEQAPAVLGVSGGVSYSEYSMLTKPQRAKTVQGDLAGFGWAWFDELVCGAAESVLKLDHPFFGEFSALTTKSVGAGRISILGTYPDQDLAEWLGKYLWRDKPQISAPRSDSQSVVVNRAFTQDGKTVHFIFNWGWQPATVNLTQSSTDVETGQQLTPGSKFQLSAWDVRVLVEESQ